MTLQINREELAWAGGFFSGEGATYWRSQIRKENNREYGAPAVEVTQCNDPEVLYRFNAAINNLCVIYGPYYNRANTDSPYYQCSVGGFEKIQAIVALLWPWLSTAKRNQAKRVLAKGLEYSLRPKLSKGKKKHE